MGKNIICLRKSFYIDRGYRTMLTENRQHYICYVSECPKCERCGNLHSHMVRSGNRWFGPYYEIRHMKKEYSKEKYLALRDNGLSSAQAHDHNRFISRNAYYCYFGKICPIQLPLVIMRYRSSRGRNVGLQLQKKRLLATEVKV